MASLRLSPADTSATAAISGHQTPGSSFYENAQAAANYSHEAVKRSKDLTTAFVDAYYGKPARRNYQIGGSRAGRKGLQAVQRYYADFDGVVSYYPAAQSQSLNLAWNRLWQVYAFNTPGGALNTAKQALLAEAAHRRLRLRATLWRTESCRTRPDAAKRST